jgi:hypothetical protein
MISHRHPFYGYGQNGEDEVIIIQEPAPPVSNQNGALKTSTPFVMGGALLSAAEIAALSVIWKKHQRVKTWPWYILAGFVGLRAVGSVVGLIEATSGSK